MMRKPRLGRGTILELQLTPMIDVVFLLLVFFLWTTSFETPEFDLAGSVAESPIAGGVGGADRPTADPFDEIVIRLVREGGGARWLINDQPVADANGLRQRVAEIVSLGVQPPIIVDPDDEIPMGIAVRAYDAARAGGADRVLFAVRH